MREAILPFALFIGALLFIGCMAYPGDDDVYRKLLDGHQQELDDMDSVLSKVEGTTDDVTKKVQTVAEKIQAFAKETDQRLGDQADLIAELAEKLASVEVRLTVLESKKPEKQVAKEPRPARVRMMFFTSDSCQNCPQYKADLVSQLGPKGWKIGEGAGNHMEIINTDGDPSLLGTWKIKVWPTILVTGPDGKEAGRLESVQDPIKVGEWLREFQVRFPFKE